MQIINWRVLSIDTFGLLKIHLDLPTYFNQSDVNITFIDHTVFNITFKRNQNLILKRDQKRVKLPELDAW